MDERGKEGHERLAMVHLLEHFREDAPASLRHVASFAGEPLEGEGEMSVFAFSASRGGEPEAEYYVVAGETAANHYPSWGLTPEQVYDLHLGTRFMLVMEVSSVPMEQLAPELVDCVRAFVRSVAPQAAVTNVQPAAAFRVADETFVVCRARIGGEEAYVMTMDAPPGIYRDVHLPPHVVFRRHLGQLIRLEMDQRD